MGVFKSRAKKSVHQDIRNMMNVRLMWMVKRVMIFALDLNVQDRMLLSFILGSYLNKIRKFANTKMKFSKIIVGMNNFAVDKTTSFANKCISN